MTYTRQSSPLSNAQQGIDERNPHRAHRRKLLGEFRPGSAAILAGSILFVVWPHLYRRARDAFAARKAAR